MTADGSLANGVHDYSVVDCVPLRVAGVFNATCSMLRPSADRFFSLAMPTANAPRGYEGSEGLDKMHEYVPSDPSQIRIHF